MLSYKGLATLIFGGLVDKYSDFFVTVKDSLPKANIKIAFRTYMSLVFLTSVTAFIASLFASLIVIQIFKVSVEIAIIIMIFVPLVTPSVTFALLIFYPYHKMASRRKDIEISLPFVLIHMGSIMESGIPPHAIFKLVAEFEEYGEISYEMKKIVRDMEKFGVDPLTAARNVAAKTPSNSLKQVLLGIVTSIESGGDVKTYLKNAGGEALFKWKMKRQRFLEQLSAYAEFYTGLMIAAPLFIIALLAVMNMISPTMGGFNIIDIMRISVYLLIPAVNIFFLAFLKGVEVEI